MSVGPAPAASYRRILVTEGGRRQRLELDSVGELYTEDDFRQLTIEATPAFLGGLGIAMV